MSDIHTENNTKNQNTRRDVPKTVRRQAPGTGNASVSRRNMHGENEYIPNRRTSVNGNYRTQKVAPNGAATRSNRNDKLRNVNYNSRKKRRKRKTGWFGLGKLSASAISLIVLIVGIAFGGLAYILWQNSFTNIILADCTEVKLSGYDGYGEAEIILAGSPEYSEFFKSVEVSLDKYTGLHNGEIMALSYVCDEELAKECRLRVDSTGVDIEVEGLPVATVYTKDDIFRGLSFSLEGTAPCVQATIENLAIEEPLSNITYSIVGDKAYYDCGDTVSVMATINPEDMANHAYAFELGAEDYYMEYSVPYGERYFTDASEISRDMLETMEQIGFRLIAESDAKEYGLRIFQGEAHVKPVFVGNKTTFQWSNPNVISAYFHNVTEDGKALRETHTNDVQIVYGVNITQADGQSVRAEIVVQFVDLKENGDGTYDLNVDSGRIVSVSHKDSNIKKLIDGDANYFTTKLF